MTRTTRHVWSDSPATGLEITDLGPMDPATYDGFEVGPMYRGTVEGRRLTLWPEEIVPPPVDVNIGGVAVEGVAL